MINVNNYLTLTKYSTEDQGAEDIQYVWSTSSSTSTTKSGSYCGKYSTEALTLSHTLFDQLLQSSWGREGG